MKGALAIRGGDAGTRALPCVLQRLPAVLEGLGQGYENDKGKEGCVLEPRRSRKKSGMGGWLLCRPVVRVLGCGRDICPLERGALWRKCGNPRLVQRNAGGLP